MASYQQQFVALMRQQEAQMAALFLEAALRIESALLRSADVNGDIPPDRQEAARQQVLALLSTLFVVVNTREGLSAYTVNRVTGAYLPETPFARIVWDTARQAGELAVDQQTSILRTALRRHPDLIDAYKRARVSPFAPDAALTDAQRSVFARYRAPQDVIRDSGRALEDSVLFAAADVRRRVRLYMNELFAEGRSAREVADALRDFLTPDTVLQRRNKPYGVNALTLPAQVWRSTPTLTRSVVGQALGALNPFVERVWVERSRAEACAICDPVAAGSPYDMENAPLLGLHPNCLCRYRFEITGQPSVEVERLRANPERMNVRGALSPDILDLLLRGGEGFA